MTVTSSRSLILLAGVALALGACASKPPVAAVKPISSLDSSTLFLTPPDETLHSPLDDLLTNGSLPEQLPPEKFRRSEVDYRTDEAPGTIIIDTREKYLYFVEEGGKALRYGVGVGRQGFGWQGTVTVGSKQQWPRWFPPKEMIVREHAKGHMIPDMMEGQIGNPLGARAMYLYDGPKDTLFRIHGTFEPKTVGTNASSGCFRMANLDVIDLYDRVVPGTKVVVK